MDRGPMDRRIRGGAATAIGLATSLGIAHTAPLARVPRAVARAVARTGGCATAVGKLDTLRLTATTSASPGTSRTRDEILGGRGSL